MRYESLGLVYYNFFSSYVLPELGRVSATNVNKLNFHM